MNMTFTAPKPQAITMKPNIEKSLKKKKNRPMPQKIIPADIVLAASIQIA